MRLKFQKNLHFNEVNKIPGLKIQLRIKKIVKIKPTRKESKVCETKQTFPSVETLRVSRWWKWHRQKCIGMHKSVMAAGG